MTTEADGPGDEGLSAAREHGERVAPRLVELVREPATAERVGGYFGVDLYRGVVPPFTGGWFERLDGGGDRPASADRITAADVLAVRTLSVRPPVTFELDLAEGALGDAVAALLARVPTDVDLVQADGLAAVLPGTAAQEAWDLLDAQDDVGWVTAGKILARKRPRLIPVWDRVLRCALDRPATAWAALHFALAADGRRLHEELLGLRERLAVGHVSALRVLDVAVWTAHRPVHRPRGCDGLGPTADDGRTGG